MSRVRINRISLILLVAAGLCALEVVPGSYPDAARSRAQNLFAPVAMPIRALAQWVQSRTSGGHVGGYGGGYAGGSLGPADVELQDENAELRVMVANLRGQLDRVDEQTAEMGYLGPVGAACTRYRVMGSDSSTRDTLTIAGSSLSGVARGMPVVYPQGLVGRIERAGPAGAQVRLIGDAGFRFTGAFARWTKDAKGRPVYSRLQVAPTLIEGIGNDTMVARGLSLEEAQKQGIEPDVWVVLDDDAWPVGLKDYHVGKVVEVGPRPDAPRFAQIVIRPSTDLLDLRDVMVMTKNPP